MAINNKFVSFKTIIERVYSRVGYQEVNWEEAIETIGDTMRKIGAIPAFREVVTNGLEGNAGPLQIVDYKALLPADLIEFKAARYVQLKNEGTTEEPIMKIVSFTPMIESNDIFIQSSIEKQNTTSISTGTYDYVDITDNMSPVTVVDQTYRSTSQYNRSYKLNNSYIFTNFESGFVELVYSAFITDDNGFPVVPDDESFIEAMVWSIIEIIDYKQWRRGMLANQVYQDSNQNKLFYIAQARNKAMIPSVAKMEAIKNMILRSIKKVDFYNDYFKSSNVQEMRYNRNS